MFREIEYFHPEIDLFGEIDSYVVIISYAGYQTLGRLSILNQNDRKTCVNSPTVFPFHKWRPLGGEGALGRVDVADLSTWRRNPRGSQLEGRCLVEPPSTCFPLMLLPSFLHPSLPGVLRALQPLCWVLEGSKQDQTPQR